MNELHLNHKTTLSIPVSRLKKSIAWYELTLGFKPVLSLESPAWCEMELPNTDLRIGLAEIQKVNPGGLALMLHTENIQSASARLQKIGVEVSEVVTVEGFAKVCSFEDPDGNPIMLRSDIEHQK